MKLPLQAPLHGDANHARARGAAHSGKTDSIDSRPAAASLRRQQGALGTSSRIVQQQAQVDAIRNSPRMQAPRISPAPATNRTGLPDQLKAGIEHVSGMAFDHVNVHYNSPLPARLQARGQVRPTRYMQGVAVNDDHALERDADVMGTMALAAGAQQLTAQRRTGLATAGARPGHALHGDLPVQLVITNNADGSTIDDYDLDDLDGYSAAYLHQQINEMGFWRADDADKAKIQAALDTHAAAAASAAAPKAKEYKKDTADKKVAVPATPAAIHKLETIQPYLDLLGHLAGEGDETTALTGGHLLIAMKAKYKNLVIYGTPSDDQPWEGWWSNGTAAPKWSSFFPAAWSTEDLRALLLASGTVKGGLELPGGISIRKTGGTFYPSFNQTLKKAPALGAMRKA